MLLWLIAGAGQSLVNLPTQTLIADRTPTALQGRVYGAHFAWSHLWWALSYPMAGWLGSQFSRVSFFYGSLIGGLLLLIVQLTLSPRESFSLNENGTAEIGGHDHEHLHDDHHQHEHQRILVSQAHTHLHQHPTFRHHHLHNHDLHHLHHPG